MLGSQLAAQLDTAAVGEANVENSDIWSRGRDALVGLLNGASFTDDFEIVLGLEQIANSATNDFVVIDEKDS